MVLIIILAIVFNACYFSKLLNRNGSFSHQANHNLVTVISKRIREY